MSFKLLAIHPLKGCDNHFLKNLKEDIFYKFYEDYDFEINKKQNNIKQIKYISIIPNDLYGKNISISAVVGKNGSGKSTILEIFSLFVFCLAEHLDLINIDEFKKSHELSEKDQNRIDKEIENFKLFNCEIYYLVDNEIFCIRKSGGKFFKITFRKSISDNLDENSFCYFSSEEIPFKSKEKFISESFFYSILSNYSLYGLNTNETGIWLKSIFHKNDGYQTPIVLNPMRTEGIIDVNRLTYLSKSRLLGNVFKKLDKDQKEEESLRSLVNQKVVKKIILELDFKKFNIVEKEDLKSKQYVSEIIEIDNKLIYLEFTAKNKNIYKHDYFNLLFEAFYPQIDYNSLSFSNTKIRQLSKEYILKKVEDIIKKYPQFEYYKYKVFRTNANENTIKKCFKDLAQDFTHSTFKIRQALNFLVHDIYNLENKFKITYDLVNSTKEGIADKVNNLRDNILKNELASNIKHWKDNPSDSDLDKNNNYTYRKHNLTNYLPPSFFEIDFKFKNEGYFKDLSSGEKQMIYSINSIIYHLINLDSIFSMKNHEGLSYRCYNIILDEIELCFHPEFQRIFISELIKSINYLRGFNYKYNIIFLTHSPFILSDIPSQNVLKLNNGEPKFKDNINSFGANIHDLLADEFFLENGFMGEFAKNKINDLLKYLTYDEIKNENEKPELEWTYESANQFIQMIGEPLLKYDLKELYLSKFYDEKKIDDEIERLQELKRQNNYDIN